MNYHIHKFDIDCAPNGIHHHQLCDYTDLMIGFKSIHFHSFYGTTSYNGHSHYFSGYTGLPIKTENGHIHRMEGQIEYNNYHDHTFEGLTQEEVSYFPHQLREATLF